MFYNNVKYVVTRKPHVCDSCGKQIPVGTKCYWFKNVAFKESEAGGNRWQEGYICSHCEQEGEK